MMLPFLGDTTIQHPNYIWWAVPAIIVLVWLINKTFVNVREDMLSQRRRKRARTLMTVTRSVIVLLLALAFATPAVVQERVIHSDPAVTLLIDNSSSMGIYDTSGVATLQTELTKRINVKTSPIADGEHSALGDSILSRIKKGDNVLLVTDGQTTSGASLSDVALYAAGNNVTLSLLRLPIMKQDMWVSIDGPTKSAEGTEVTLNVNVGSTGAVSGRLTVKIDDEVVLDQDAAPGTYPIVKTLAAGTHTITASVDAKDAFAQNNVFYKTLKVVPKPKIFYWSQKSNPPMAQLYGQVYNVEEGTSLPSNLDPYYAIVLDDLPGSDIMVDQSHALTNFVTDGGGVFVAQRFIQEKPC